MKPNYKFSISSRASVKSLIVVCLPTTAVAFVANTPALSAAFRAPTNQVLTVDDNAVASTNSPSTNGSSSSTNSYNKPSLTIQGVRG
jgi:hypothetical protein